MPSLESRRDWNVRMVHLLEQDEPTVHTRRAGQVPWARIALAVLATPMVACGAWCAAALSGSAL